MEDGDRPLLPSRQQAQEGWSPGVPRVVRVAGVLWLGYLLEINRLVPLFPAIR